MHLDERVPLAEIVTCLPGAARVLEELRLDYCCRGERPLGEACRAAGLDADSVLDRLASLPPALVPDWVAMDALELVDHLECTHHRPLHDELPRLCDLAEFVAGRDGRRHPELLDVFADVLDLHEELGPHLLKEELVLFPTIRRLAGRLGTAAGPSGTAAVRMQWLGAIREHEVLIDLLDRLRADAGDFESPADAGDHHRDLLASLAELERDLHLLMHKENHLLLPAVAGLVGAG